MELVVRFFVLLILAAIACFLVAIVIDKSAVINFAELFFQLGISLLLSAMMLIVASGLTLVMKGIADSVRDYFSVRLRLERKVLYYLRKHNNISQLYACKKARLLYDHQQQKKRLLKKDTQKSLSL